MWIFEQLLDDIKEKELLLKEYNTILDTIPNIEDIKEIEKEIYKLRVAVESSEEFEQLEEELNVFETISKQIEDVSCNITTGRTSRWE